VVALAVAGVGLGLFIPANNAAVMSCTPKAESGVASGVLNMARGMGTALGLVLTGLVYALAASPRGGLRSSLIFLAAVAGAAGAIALLSGSAGSAGGLTRS
jgi:hypothetical protein